jgi:plastocyanin domain-containing protein|tara:strand:+ start:174 stop:386 length:213 start_codon:yes stop_codon:yes gene_type:complete
MSEDSKSSISILIKSTEKLLKRFNEQKGIIDAYIKKEREWKKHKLVQANEIKKLEKVNAKLAKIIKSHEQ